MKGRGFGLERHQSAPKLHPEEQQIKSSTREEETAGGGGGGYKRETLRRQRGGVRGILKNLGSKLMSKKWSEKRRRARHYAEMMGAVYVLVTPHGNWRFHSHHESELLQDKCFQLAGV